MSADHTLPAVRTACNRPMPPSPSSDWILKHAQRFESAWRRAMPSNRSSPQPAPPVFQNQPFVHPCNFSGEYLFSSCIDTRPRAASGTHTFTCRLCKALHLGAKSYVRIHAPPLTATTASGCQSRTRTSNSCRGTSTGRSHQGANRGREPGSYVKSKSAGRSRADVTGTQTESSSGRIGSCGQAVGTDFSAATARNNAKECFISTLSTHHTCEAIQQTASSTHVAVEHTGTLSGKASA